MSTVWKRRWPFLLGAYCIFCHLSGWMSPSWKSALRHLRFLTALILPPVMMCFFLLTGVLGKCHYVYCGKNSEGNRFIRDDQLWRQTLYTFAYFVKIKRKGKKNKKPKKETMTHFLSLGKGCGFSCWYLVLTLPGSSRSSVCLTLSGHREIDMIALKQVSSTRVTDSGSEAPGLTAWTPW